MRVWHHAATTGGRKEGTCMEHRERKSVWVFQQNRWVDTGLCARDFDIIKRLDARIEKALKKAEKGR